MARSVVVKKDFHLTLDPFALLSHQNSRWGDRYSCELLLSIFFTRKVSNWNTGLPFHSSTYSQKYCVGISMHKIVFNNPYMESIL